MDINSLWDKIVADPVWSAVVAGLIVVAVVGMFRWRRNSKKQSSGDQINISNENQSGGQSVQVGKINVSDDNE